MIISIVTCNEINKMHHFANIFFQIRCCEIFQGSIKKCQGFSRVSSDFQGFKNFPGFFRISRARSNPVLGQNKTCYKWAACPCRTNQGTDLLTHSSLILICINSYGHSHDILVTNCVTKLILLWTSYIMQTTSFIAHRPVSAQCAIK